MCTIGTKKNIFLVEKDLNLDETKFDCYKITLPEVHCNFHFTNYFELSVPEKLCKHFCTVTSSVTIAVPPGGYLSLLPTSFWTCWKSLISAQLRHLPGPDQTPGAEVCPAQSGVCGQTRGQLPAPLDLLPPPWLSSATSRDVTSTSGKLFRGPFPRASKCVTANFSVTWRFSCLFDSHH